MVDLAFREHLKTSVLQLLASTRTSTMQRSIGSLICAVAQCSTERQDSPAAGTTAKPGDSVPILFWPALVPSLVCLAMGGDVPFIADTSPHQPDHQRRTVALEVLGWLLQAIGASLTPTFAEFAQLQDLLVQAVLDPSHAVQAAGLSGFEELVGGSRISSPLIDFF